MKVLLLTFLLIVPSTYVIAQKTREWDRVYTFEESIIEMNTSNVIVGGDIGRVTFRWTFDQLETLKGNPELKYKSRLETIEFRCVDQRYRYYEVSLFDSTGKKIHSELMRPPYEWHEIKSEVMGTISGPACRLIREKIDPEETKRTLDEANESDRVAMFARSIKDELETSRNFKPLVEKFFVAGFVKRYIADRDTNWFYNLNRDTAEKASPTELQRFYLASLNAGYLTSLYLISQSPSEDDSIQEGSAPEGKMIPAEVYQLINSHPYTLTYKGKAGGGYDYLAENIDSIARMRSYTDLLEKIAVLMRKRVIGVQAERSQQYQQMLEEDSDVQSRVCPSEYLGLPKGTKLFDMSLPLLRLQFAEIKGELKIVSARDSSH